MKAQSKYLGLSDQNTSKQDLQDDVRGIIESITGNQNSSLNLQKMHYSSSNPFIQNVASVQQLQDLYNHTSSNKFGDKTTKGNQVVLPNINDSLQVLGTHKQSGLQGQMDNNKDNLNSIEDLNNIEYIFNQDSTLYEQRLKVIKNKLDEEIIACKPISKDHLRTNKNGVNLEQLENIERNPFRHERKSVDVTHLKKKKLAGSGFHSRKQSQFSIKTDLMLESPTAQEKFMSQTNSLHKQQKTTRQALA